MVGYRTATDEREGAPLATAGILLAGGSGRRMRSADNKVFATVGGHSLLAWSLAAFAGHDAIEVVVLVVRAHDQRRVNAQLAAAGLADAVHAVAGGRSRQASEHAGLEALAAQIDSGTVDVVAIHDVARPFATAELIARTVRTARDVGGAVPVLPLGGGIYRTTDDGRLVAESDDLNRVQTPQAFHAAPLLDAYRAAAHDRFAGIDTVETVHRYTQLDVAAVPGDPDNMKITFAADLRAAERIAAARDGAVRPTPVRHLRAGSRPPDQ